MGLPIDFLVEIALPSLFGAGSGLLLVRFLGEKLLEQKLAQDLERYRHALAEQSDVLKTNLSIYAHEQTTALSRIDTQTSAAINDIYFAFRNWEIPARKLHAGSPWVDVDDAVHVAFYSEHSEAAHNAAMDLHKKLADYAIYFDIDDFTQMQDIATKCTACVSPLLKAIRQARTDGASDNMTLQWITEEEDKLAPCTEATFGDMQESIIPLFRRLLGLRIAHAES